MTFDGTKLTDNIDGSKKPSYNSRYMDGDRLVQVSTSKNEFTLCHQIKLKSDSGYF